MTSLNRAGKEHTPRSRKSVEHQGGDIPGTANAGDPSFLLRNPCGEFRRQLAGHRTSRETPRQPNMTR
jgi:hypothetical protein